MFFKIRNSLNLIIILAFIYGCGHSDPLEEKNSKINKKECSQKEQNRLLYEHMKDAYLWYDKVPKVAYCEYNDTKQLLEDLKYKKYDKWSYIISSKEYYDYYEEGVFVGFGLIFAWKEDILFVSFVYPDSSADKAGFQRGMEIISINNYQVSQIKTQNLWDKIFQNHSIGTEGVFEVLKDNNHYTITSNMEELKINSVFKTKIIQKNNRQIGYFVLNSFIEPTRLELKNLFEHFKQENIDELVIDLRYNGGGRINVANYLVNLIAGEYINGELWEKIEYNNKYSYLNKNFYFDNTENSLNLKRVFILSSQNTCSASELIIDGLKPYMDIYLIGDTTCGKPVGMRGIEFCDKHLSPISFKISNSNEDDSYFSGIEPNCLVLDDLTYQLGDNNESLLKEALFFIENENCSNYNKTLQSEKKENPKSSPLKKGFSDEINIW